MADLAAEAGAETAADRGYDTSDPEQVNLARQKSGRTRAAQLAMVGAVMEQRQGRAWLYSLLDMGHIFQPSYVNGDPYGTAFREGERNIALRLLADIQAAAPEHYMTMIREAKGR